MVRSLLTCSALIAALFPLTAWSSNALLDAANQRNTAAISALLKTSKGQKLLEARDARGRTPLLVSTWLDDQDSAQVLLQAGADVNAKDNQQDSPYLVAGAEGRTQLLRWYLEHNAKLEDTNRYGGTAIIPAAEKGHLDNVRVLIDAGINLNHVNKLGWTALMEAIVLSNGGPRHQAIVAALLEAGADPNIPDHQGITPLAHAKQRQQTAMVQLLNQAGAK